MYHHVIEIFLLRSFIPTLFATFQRIHKTRTLLPKVTSIIKRKSRFDQLVTTTSSTPPSTPYYDQHYGMIQQRM